MSDNIKQTSIETIEIEKCSTGFIVYLYNINADIIAKKAFSILGNAGYAGYGGSVFEAIDAVFSNREGE